MAWTTPRTWIPGELVTALMMNTHVRDNMNYLFANIGASPSSFGAGSVSAPSVAVGDTDVGLYSSGTNALDFTTNGTKALGITATQFISSPTQPRCIAYHSTTQSIPDSTSTMLNLNNEDVDVGSMHDTSVNNTRITVPTGGDGLYLVFGQTGFAANGTGYREIGIRKNGGTVVVDRYCLPTAGFTTTEGIVWMGVLAAADYVELFAQQTSGGSLNVGSTNRYDASQLYVVKLW